MMTAEHKAFIREKLIPFILGEQGRGFAMDEWLETYDPGKRVAYDDLEREVPDCGTVACIGGSIQVLTKCDRVASVCGSRIGLEEPQYHTLFYGWVSDWPQPFRDDYVNAQTTADKARVACDLLEEVCKTDGACLIVSKDPDDDDEDEDYDDDD